MPVAGCSIRWEGVLRPLAVRLKDPLLALVALVVLPLVPLRGVLVALVAPQAPQALLG